MAHEILLNGGDSIDERTIQTAFAAMGDGYIEQDALGVQYFDSDDTIDTEAALARVPDGNRDIPLFVDAIVNYQLEVGALNHVWLAVDPSAATDNEAVGLRHNTTGVAPTDPSLEIAEVDTNKSGDAAVTLLNRGNAPSLDGADINPRSIGREQPAEDIAATSASIGTLTGTTAAEDLSANSLDVGPVSAESLSGVTYLLGEHDESTVRALVEGGSPGDAFVVEPGASWTLSDTLAIPRGVTIHGNTEASLGASTFKKGFDGALATVEDFCSLINVGFHGNKANNTGNVVEVTKARDCYYRNVVFGYGAGDGFHVDDHFFNTFVGCRFERNDGWGVWMGPSENPHNQWLGPCYIASNGAGGVYEASYGRNQQMLAYVGKNGGPGIQFSDPENHGGFAAFCFQGALNSNDGPGFLVTGGTQRGFRIADAQIANNAGAPDPPAPDPAAQIHIAGGQLMLTLQGGQAYGHGRFVESTSSANSNIAILSAGNERSLRGTIVGPDTLRAFISDTSVVDKYPYGIDLTAGVGVKMGGVSGAPGALVDPSTGNELYQRA